MESLAIVLKAPIRGRWATSIDLKDAYLHIPINQDHQRWLRFHIKDQAYAFRCLPFGLSTAPRVFTRVVKAVGAFLRRQGVQIHFYLDDWLITSQSLVMAHRHTDLVLRTLARLGFIVNLKKSHLQDPSSSIYSTITDQIYILCRNQFIFLTLSIKNWIGGKWRATF